ncbi:hypothetical protein [Actinoplanes sp. NPDC051851]|uniref:hypothetical protein n=1 Tax=Actinoplanes sp. NPDC051851 TaxID=3154753 RepID=UPI0034390CB1
MSLAAVREDVAVIDELLREIAERPVDLSDPGWLPRLRRGPAAVDEAGVAAEAGAALTALLDAYEKEEDRAEVREIFRAHRYFRWAVHLPGEWESAAELRRHLMHVSAMDQGADPRDQLLTI